MSIRFRAAILLLLSALAAHSAASAVESVRPAWEAALPRELYSRLIEGAEEPAYLLRVRDGVVAVYEGENRRTPALVTDIDVTLLRRADRAMLEKGIPVSGREELLALLEDLGS